MEEILIPKDSNILVTGGAGFIGSHIVDKLLLSGHKVIIADDLSTGKEQNINPGAVFYKTDISDENALKAIFQKHTITYVIHEAAKMNLNVMREDPGKDIRSSVLGTINILKCCIEFNVKKIIYASSVAVYGRPQKLPVCETDELKPVYSYGIAKKCAEEYIRYYSDYYGLNYSILRYANVYGPRQPVYGEVGVIAIYTERIINGEPLIIFGDGSQLRDYIYVDDVVDCTLGTLISGDRETFNVGCGAGISVKEVFECFCSVYEKKIPYGNKPERVGELGYFWCNNSKLSAIGCSPKISIKEGINRTYSYYKNKEKKIVNKNSIFLRPVSLYDKEMIFRWRNTPFLINLGTSRKGVTVEDHNKWFDKVLNNKSTFLFIINFENIPVGQVRFDFMEKNIYDVSIYILEEYTGKGIGPVALRKGLALMNERNENLKFIAFIKQDNEFSRSVFSKTGFKTIKDHKKLPAKHIAMEYCNKKDS